jgi:hypothetical protein
VAVEHQEVVDTATSATWLGGLKYSAGWVGAVFAAAGSLVGVVLAVGIVADLVTSGTPSGLVGGLVRLADGTFARSGTGLAGALVLGGNVLLVGFAGGLLLAGRGALLNASTRRGLNVIWDVIAFWPREAHPIAPPPYSQRAVRDLADRITWLLTTDPECRVVLAGHSQGSLICAATILRVRADLHPRIALLTHGSQLQYAYSRAFPGYLNAPYLRWLLRTLGDRWINLFRTTDPLGGPVLSWHRSPEEESARWQSARLTGTGVAQEEDDVDALGARRCGHDWRLLDPAVVDPSLRPWPGARRHSDFPRDPAWAVAVARLATALGVSPGPAAPPADGRAARPAAPPLRPRPPGSP